MGLTKALCARSETDWFVFASVKGSEQKQTVNHTC